MKLTENVLIISPIETIEFPERTYDLVTASEMLMHIPNEKIGMILEKLVKASKKYIINIDWYVGKPKIQDYCFSHDYETMYKKLGCDVTRFSLKDNYFHRILHNTPKINQSIFIAVKG